MVYKKNSYHEGMDPIATKIKQVYIKRGLNDFDFDVF